VTERGTAQLELKLPAACDAGLTLEFFRPRAIKGVEQVTGNTYARSFVSAGAAGIVEATVGRKAISVTIRHARAGQAAVQAAASERLTRLFNLSPIDAGAARLFRQDPILAKTFAANRTLRVPGCWEPFELGVRAILGQQVSVAGATTLAGRIAAKYGQKLKGGAGDITHAFPAPAELAGADLGGLGLTTRRAATITGFARAVSETPSLLDTTKPIERFVEDLVALNGFGPWTAHYMAMRHGYPDAFPASDLGVRKALNMAPEREAQKIAEAWRPWRSTAVMLLWKSLA
jgi:AraC family transcriptional regulator, regulatory protein of adaptative response / DNA-3-methyladenine glycosylase II